MEGCDVEVSILISGQSQAEGTKGGLGAPQEGVSPSGLMEGCDVVDVEAQAQVQVQGHHSHQHQLH